MPHESDSSSFSLATLPARHGAPRLAMAMIAASLAVFGIGVFFAARPLVPVAAFYPMYQSAVIVCEAITGVFLLGQFALVRSTGVLVLAAGYLFSAFMALAHALSFPGLFAPAGLLGSGPQTTAWIYFLWHIGFAAAVIGYALLRERADASAGAGIAGGVLAALAAAVALTALATSGQEALPAIMNGDRDLPRKYTVAWITWLVTLAAVPALWRRKLSVLDLWLAVVIFTSLCDVALAAVFNAGRYSVGWYMGRMYGLLASSFVLGVLLLENVLLRARSAPGGAALSEPPPRRA